MKTTSFFAAATLAFGLAGAPTAGTALDLGDTVSKASRSVSKTTRSATRSVGSVTRSVSRSVGGTVDSVSRSVGSTVDSVGSTVDSVTSGVQSTTESVTSSVGLSGESSVSGDSSGDGRTTATVGVLSNYQLICLKLESNQSVRNVNGQHPATVTPDFVTALVAGLDGTERRRLRTRCETVLRSPKAFDSELILLCQILATI